MISANIAHIENQFSNVNSARNKQYFEEMLQQDSLDIAQPFLIEEGSVIINLIKENSVKEFLGIGCGNGLYFDLLKNTCNYTGIDPHSKQNNIKETMTIIKNRFEKVNMKRSRQKCLISFLFNLISYVNPADIIKFININASQRDIITVSTWNNTANAQKLRYKYFKHFTKKSSVEIPSNSHNFIEFESKLISAIRNYKYHDLIEFSHSKLLIVYL